jgi:pSer/pThr/pTyr-binding forkhead associated (FHA) protein
MKLYFLNGDRAGSAIDLTKSVYTLGREEDNTIFLLAAGVSRYHARLEQLSNLSWQITDLNSTNGVKINNIAINTAQLLVDGDIFTLGDQAIRLGEKKDMRSEIAAAFIPENPPVIQPGLTGRIDFNNPSKVIFEPVNNSGKPAEVLNSPQTQNIFIAENDVSPETNNKSKLMSFINIKAEAAKEQISDAVIKGTMNIFGSKDHQQNTNKQDSPRKRFSNLLFYVLVICAAAIFISSFIAYQESNKTNTEQKTVNKSFNAPFILYYEKDKVSTDSLFRFTLRLENDKAYFSIFDLKSQRKYIKNIEKINPQQLENLKKEIESTNFMSLQPQPTGVAVDNQDEIRKLVISFDFKLNSITVKNSYAPSSFEAIERAINEFSGNFGLQTIAMLPDELKRNAEDYYNKAEDLFQNREAKPGRLLEAIYRYRTAVEYLDQFSPKPEIWHKARQRCLEAEDLKQKMLKDLDFEYMRLYRLNEFEKLKEVTEKIMELYPVDSQEYQNIRLKSMQIDKILKSRNKR